MTAKEVATFLKISVKTVYSYARRNMIPMYWKFQTNVRFEKRQIIDWRREVARLLRAASSLTRPPSSPIRPEVIRLAIVLLFTTGIRRGELLRLRLGDYNRRDSTLLIRESKFHKSRLLPINAGIADEIESYLRARIRHRLPVSPDVAFIWNSTQGGRAYNGPGLQMCLRPLLRQCGILTSKGKLPRIHDARHSFAVNALLRWYRIGADVDAKLPLLAT